MDGVVIARAVHVAAVVIWIGGVAMVTTIVLPAVRRGDLGVDRLKAFASIERRFVWQARTAVIIVGVTGLYMTTRLDLWPRVASAALWWMHAMVCVWLLFAAILFVGEPLILHRWFDRWAKTRPEVAVARLHRAHWVLLVLSLVTIIGAVVGANGL